MSWFGQTYADDDRYVAGDADEDPEPAEDNSPVATSDRAWFGSRLDNESERGHDWYSPCWSLRGSAVAQSRAWGEGTIDGSLSFGIGSGVEQPPHST